MLLLVREMIKVFHVSHWLSHFFCRRCHSYPLLLHFLFGGFMSRLYATFSPRRKLCNVENLFPTLLFNALFFSLLFRQTFSCRFAGRWLSNEDSWWEFLFDGKMRWQQKIAFSCPTWKDEEKVKQEKGRRDVFLFALIWWMVWLVIWFFLVNQL